MDIAFGTQHARGIQPARQPGFPLTGHSLLSPEHLQSQELWHKAAPILAGMGLWILKMCWCESPCKHASVKVLRAGTLLLLSSLPLLLETFTHRWCRDYWGVRLLRVFRPPVSSHQPRLGPQRRPGHTSVPLPGPHGQSLGQESGLGAEKTFLVKHILRYPGCSHWPNGNMAANTSSVHSLRLANSISEVQTLLPLGQPLSPSPPCEVAR